MKKTLICKCGGNMSYKTDQVTPDEFIDNLFHSNHTGEGHEVKEQLGVYLGDEEE